jgi:hypothetical protein
MPNGSTPPGPDLEATANTILALASAGVDPSGARNALTYMKGQVDNYVTVDGSDGPGQLALLILDAHALGANPESFGGTNLVARLLATERTTGTNAGLFGAQDPTYNGAYRQGLALAALAAVGDTASSKVGAPEAWLTAQQCPDGGWTSYVTTDNPCNGDPADYEGPDTNSTALAVEGLSAQGVLGSKAAGKALRFIEHAQNRDGGWGYEPNAADAPGSSDPDSTALVIQAVLALGKSPSANTFVQGGANPVSTLESFQLTSGSGSGAFFYPGSSDPDTLATYQAVPAAAGVKFPFNLAITTTSLPAGVDGRAYSATLSASGGNAPYTWELASGSGPLPSGLRLSKSGTISGKPTGAGSTFTVEVLDTKTATVPHTRNIAWHVLTIST